MGQTTCLIHGDSHLVGHEHKQVHEETVLAGNTSTAGLDSLDELKIVETGDKQREGMQGQTTCLIHGDSHLVGHEHKQVHETVLAENTSTGLDSPDKL